MKNSIIKDYQPMLLSDGAHIRVYHHNCTIDVAALAMWSAKSTSDAESVAFSSDKGQLRIAAWREALRRQILADASEILPLLSREFEGLQVGKAVRCETVLGVTVTFATPALGLPWSRVALSSNREAQLKVADSALERKGAIATTEGFGYAAMCPLLTAYSMALSLELASKKKNSMSASTFDSAGYDKALQQFDQVINAMTPATACSTTDVVFVTEQGVWLPRNPFDPAWREGAINGNVLVGDLATFIERGLTAESGVVNVLTTAAASDASSLLVAMAIQSDDNASCYNDAFPSIALGQWSLVTNCGTTWNAVSTDLGNLLVKSPRTLLGLFDDYVAYSIGAGTELEFDAWQGMYQYFTRTLTKCAGSGAVSHNRSVEPGSIYKDVMDAVHEGREVSLSPAASALLRYHTWSITSSQVGSFTAEQQRAINSLQSAPFPTKALAEELGLQWSLVETGNDRATVVRVSAPGSNGHVDISWSGIGVTTPQLEQSDLDTLLPAWHKAQELLALIDALLATDTRGLVINETVDGVKVAVRSRAMRVLQGSVPGFASIKESVVSPLYLTSSRASQLLREIENG